MVLLLVPMADCGLFGGERHGHSAPAAAATVIDPVPGSARVVADGHANLCAPHAVHCVLSAAPPAGGLPALPLLFLIAALILVLTPLSRAASAGVRGPPPDFVPVVGGRELLTRICIARR
ncbi:hypothetical protein [Nocardia seriolae]|uniref:hypothetical protein n=1 Tax=Nocardia seriolae TaxID=37332 RepID=UPI0011AB3875|nr:hypothetical protein [Nocardia seriolae]MTJ74876.1 hypothetical protein [Nocardia seriolae]MTK30972.1 hypothetical protein [Nocardia seriolae]MTK47544.1 hypothetical protein [Nocardia seriolae]QOW34085.1 hypothetical protein IMZ23_02830 [Nocardia seriolae]QUN18410.1 hypothetical protein KEC46_02895 [Nocardia seriolae]